MVAPQISVVISFAVSLFLQLETLNKSSKYRLIFLASYSVYLLKMYIHILIIQSINLPKDTLTGIKVVCDF